MSRQNDGLDHLMPELKDASEWTSTEAPHYLAIIGQEKTRRWVNIIGPYPNKKDAINAAARSRARGKKEGLSARNKLTYHVCPLMPVDWEEG